MQQHWERQKRTGMCDLGFAVLFRVNDNSDDVLGHRFSSQLAAAGRQVTMSRHQSAEICSNRSSCRIRSSRNKHREIVRDAKEGRCATKSKVATQHSNQLWKVQTEDRGNAYNIVHGDIITVGTERFRWTEFTTTECGVSYMVPFFFEPR